MWQYVNFVINKSHRECKTLTTKS